MYRHLNEDLLLEMAEIGRIRGYKVLIFGSEDPIPHFHVENKEKKIYTCIKILENDYFQHGRYKDKLPANIKVDLINFLNSPHKFFGKYGFTNWQIICVYWNDNNPNFAITEELENLQMPKYENL